MIVYIYRNITKRVWSVRDVSTGRVIQHADSLILFDATFHVSEAGRQKVLQERRKNVHAGIKGRLVPARSDLRRVLSHGVQVSYDPYRFKSFVITEDETPVDRAVCVYFQADGRVRAIGVNDAPDCRRSSAA